MHKRIEKLYADLARTLGVNAVTADADGSVQLTIGADERVILFAENEFTLMLVAPVIPLPRKVDYGRALFLLRRNFYDSPLAPFRVSCDQDGGIVLWGRVPVEGLDGKGLAALVDALATEAKVVRGEVEIDE